MKDCHTCDFRAGEHGQRCQVCQKSTFVHVLHSCCVSQSMYPSTCRAYACNLPRNPWVVITHACRVHSMRCPMSPMCTRHTHTLCTPQALTRARAPDTYTCVLPRVQRSPLTHTCIGRYLHEGKCLADCDGTGLAPYLPATASLPALLFSA